jgi:hypothetical protein
MNGKNLIDAQSDMARTDKSSTKGPLVMFLHHSCFLDFLCVFFFASLRLCGEGIEV